MRDNKLFLIKEDLYRIGNSNSSRLANVRPSEVATVEINGVTTIIADGNGVSVFTKDGLEACHLTGWVWEISKSTPLPQGLNIVKRGSLGHHMIVPVFNMPVSQYVGLLEQVAIHCKRTFKKSS